MAGLRRAAADRDLAHVVLGCRAGPTARPMQHSWEALGSPSGLDPEARAAAVATDHVHGIYIEASLLGRCQGSLCDLLRLEDSRGKPGLG